MHIEIVPVPVEQVAEAETSESREVIRTRVMRARNIQDERFKDYP